MIFKFKIEPILNRTYIFKIEKQHDIYRVKYLIYNEKEKFFEYIKQLKSKNITTEKSLKMFDEHLEKWISKNLKELDNSNCVVVREKIIEIENDILSNANKHKYYGGLDGFCAEVEIERHKFKIWCEYIDDNYIKICDLINSLLDNARVEKEFRFKKVMK